MFYPWQQSIWQNLIALNTQKTLPHALLFTGPMGTGKADFANALAAALLCSSPQANGLACDECSSCKLYLAGNHPDFHLVAPEEEGKALVVDQIRELGKFLQLKTHFSGKKIAVIYQADAMNVAASNSLLKSLEEPPADSLIMLVSNHMAKLLPTIRSRCQQRVFSIPETNTALPWLNTQVEQKDDAALLLSLAGGAPLLAKQFAQDNVRDIREQYLSGIEKAREKPASILKTAEAWAKKDTANGLYWLSSLVIDMVRLRTNDAPPALANTDIKQRLHKVASQCDYLGLVNFCGNLFKAKSQLKANVNAELLLTDLLIQWSELA